MNAAIAAGAAPPRGVASRHNLRPRQIVVAVLLAVAGVLAAVFTFRAVTAQNTYPAVLRPSFQADLNFGTAGRLAEIDVHPGDRVRAGQVLAREDQTVAQANLAAARAILTADQAQLQQLQSPELSSAVQEQLQLEVSQAQVQVANATAALNDAQSLAQSDVAQQQGVIASAKNVVASDQASFAQACPSGAVPPSPNPAQPTASATSSPTPTTAAPSVTPTPSPSPTPNNGVSQAAYVTCLTLQYQLEKDNATLVAAQGALAVVQAMATQSQNASGASLALNQAMLRLAANQMSVQAAPGTAAQIATATAQIAKDQSAVSQAEDALTQTTIVAPTDGLVANVNGGVGELVSDTGVHNYPGPAAVAPPSTAFSLFPPAPQSASGAQQDAFSSLVTLYSTGDMPIVAQVPEGQITGLHIGQRAKVTIAALAKTLDVTVERVVSDPAQVPGSVTYDVILHSDQFPAGALPGMSATVEF